MRTAAIAASLLLVFTACSTSQPSSQRTFDQPNDLMAGEINRRIDQIPYLHREELLDNLLWLAQTGEQAIPALLEGLQNDSAKVRSSAAWVLGRLRDRRTIPQLQAAVSDSEPTVQLECARTLVLLGDLEPAPVLIEGLDSDRKEVRYLCHEALKSATGHDFGYDHLAADQTEMQGSVLSWRQWWSDFSGDEMFASSYASEHGLNEVEPAAPAGEIQPAPPKVEPVQMPEAPNQEPPSVEVIEVGEVVEVPDPESAPKTGEPGSADPAVTPVIEIPSTPMPSTEKPVEVPVLEIEMPPLPVPGEAVQPGATPTNPPASKPNGEPNSKPNSAAVGGESGVTPNSRHQ